MPLLTAHSKGSDAFGAFVVMAPDDEAPICGSCGADVELAIKYFKKTFSLPNKIEIGKTILGDVRSKLGINCGCYGKFHRQVAHIQDNMKGG